MNTASKYSGTASVRPTESEPLPFRQAFLAMLGICLVLMLSALDQTVISNALPAITADLNGFDYYAWVATGYLLTSIISIPIFGRLGDHYGRKPFVAAAAIVFVFSSLGCALASNIQMLVIGRCLQGVGGGMLIGTAFACVPELFPDTRRRLRWQIMLSASFSVVNALGPSLGGLLTDAFGWRSVFYINIPVGGIALIFVLRYLPWFKPARGTSFALDWPGIVLITIGLYGLQMFVESLPTLAQGWLAPCYGLLTLWCFIGLWRWERKASSPIFPASIFTHRDLRLLFSVSVLVGAVMFALLFYMPLLYQGSFGYSSQQAGVLITPMVLSITLGAIVNTRIVRHFANPNWLPRAGLITLIVACAGLCLCNADSNFALLMGLMLLAGIGLGFTLLNLTLFTQQLSPAEHLGIATAMQQGLRLVGGMIGAAAMAAITNLMYHHGMITLLATGSHAPIPAALATPQALLSASANQLNPLQVAQAREILGGAISYGILGLAVTIAIALALLWQVRPVQLMASKK